MSVDKFGRYSRNKTYPQKGPKGDGFNLTAEGDFNINNKLLRNVKSPLHPSDATTKLYVDSKVPLKLQDSYSFHTFRAQDLGQPVNYGDAINLRYVKENCVQYTRSENNQLGTIDAKMNKIINVAEPEDNNDVVNLKYINSNALCLKEGAFDAKGSTISNVGKPREVSDVVTKGYLKEALAGLGYALYVNAHRRKPEESRGRAIRSDIWKGSLLRHLDLYEDPWSAWDVNLNK